MALNTIYLAPHCHFVRAQAFPPEINQRPGVTLLVARSERLRLETATHGQQYTWLLAVEPQLSRRFVKPQPHYSVTIEPGHPRYLSFLAAARCAFEREPCTRLNALRLARIADHIESAKHVDEWLDLALRHLGGHDVPLSTDLSALLTLAQTQASAESAWRAFRQGRDGTQAFWSKWCQRELGVSLRKIILWRKVRHAMELVATPSNATTIAHTVGFADSAHLSRVCRRAFGLRPRDALDGKTLQVVQLANR